MGNGSRALVKKQNHGKMYSLISAKKIKIKKSHQTKTHGITKGRQEDTAQ